MLEKQTLESKGSGCCGLVTYLRTALRPGGDRRLGAYWPAAQAQNIGATQKQPPGHTELACVSIFDGFQSKIRI